MKHNESIYRIPGMELCICNIKMKIFMCTNHQTKKQEPLFCNRTCIINHSFSWRKSVKTTIINVQHIPKPQGPLCLLCLLCPLCPICPQYPLCSLCSLCPLCTPLCLLCSLCPQCPLCLQCSLCSLCPLCPLYPLCP